MPKTEVFYKQLYLKSSVTYVGYRKNSQFPCSRSTLVFELSLVG